MAKISHSDKRQLQGTMLEQKIVICITADRTGMGGLG